MSRTEELELVLDRQPIEYPALVKEAFFRVNRDDLTHNSASLNDTHCWILSKNSLYIWDRSKPTSGSRTSIQLPLPPSGLPHSVKCVVIYHSKSRPKSKSIGVVIVSREGVARHWPSVHSQSYAESVFELESEVVLTVELLDPPSDGRPASFALTTTSGSIHFLRGSDDPSHPQGTLLAHKVIARSSTGIRRRLSSLIFGSAPEGVGSSTTRSVLFYNKKESCNIGLVSARSLIMCDLRNNDAPLWSLKTDSFFLPAVKEVLEMKLRQEVNGLRVNLVDVSSFRQGYFALLAAQHEDSNAVSLFLAYVDELTDEAPFEPTWAAQLPTASLKSLIDVDFDEVGNNLQLVIPRNTGKMNKSERTDGIIVLHTSFVQAVYVPDDLKKSAEQKKYDLVLCKTTALLPRDRLVGVAQSAQHCYIMMLDGGIFSVRLLPKGFATDTIVDDDEALSEMLTEMVNVNVNGGHPATERLLKAFVLFGEKSMAESSAELQPLKQRVDMEFAENISQFLISIVDYSDPSNSIEAELRAKKVFAYRMLLFLRHMGLYDKVANARVNVPNSEGRRTGLSMLAEMNERIGVALALRDFQQLSSNNREALIAVARYAEKSAGELAVGVLDAESMLFGKLTLIHFVPAAIVDTLRAGLNKRVVSAGARQEMLHVAADAMVAFIEGVEITRSSPGAVQLDGTTNLWTCGSVAIAFETMAKILIDEINAIEVSSSERARLTAYIVRLFSFHLSETGEQPEGHPLLRKLFEQGESAAAVLLAERFKDFKTLIKICLLLGEEERQVQFEAYKKRYVEDDFEMYLCKYFKEKGLNELLLTQRGQRVDEYLNNFKELRYSREIANKQYEKAARTLANLAASEKNNFDKFAMYLSQAKNCASACEDAADDILEFYQRRAPEVKGRRAIPAEVIETVYPGNPNVMLTIDQLIEINMIPQSTDEESTLSGYLRALNLVSDLLQVEKSSEVKRLLMKVWSNVLDCDEWARCKSSHDVSTTVLGKLLAALVERRMALPGSAFPSWEYAKRLEILPNLDDLLSETAKNFADARKAAAWVRSAFAAARTQLQDLAKRPKASFYELDAENSGPIAMAAFAKIGPALSARRRHPPPVESI
ncbi:unnamed protein product [Caenorhabditis auriculariae]|uniref:Nucleoporin Nup133/Nup155-like N-terminal domain-containing protein n=1 Tax=Caenorhabditis auriculariae TaxID=2777116 RepID=A0A8S1H0M2_9PELO|nr:unnamed protein product [Caenorhabditis auriculariae]